MSTVNEQDIERFMELMGKHAPTMDAYLKALEARRKAEEEDTKSRKTERDRRVEFNNKLDEANQSLRGFTRGADEAIGTLTKMMLAPLGKTAFIGIAAFTALWSAGSKLNDTWRDMAEIGQTFGGSMFKMSHAAAAAGLPLETFTKLQKSYNVLIGTSGNKFWQVNKQLSDNIIRHGMYGMSLEQLGEFTGTYMETARRNGALQSRSVGQMVSDFDDLAATTTALASTSDKARGEIAKLAANAMQSAVAIANMQNLPLEVRGAVNKAMAEATTVLASLPGEAGQFMANFFNEAGNNGAVFAQGGQTVINAGLSELASQMQFTADAVASGRKNGIEAGIELQASAIDAVNNNMETLRIQAMSGNQAAAEMIRMFAGQKKLTLAEIEEKKKEARATESFTALMASISAIWTKIKAAFTNSFGDAFARTFDGFHDFANSDVFKKITEFATHLGTRLGELLGTALTASNIDRLTKGIENVAVGFISVFDAILAFSPVWDGIVSTIGFFGKAISWVTGLFGKMGAEGGHFVGKLLGAGLVIAGAVKLFRGIRSLFGGSDMTINARVVNVNGGDGGGGGGGGGGKRGRMGRMMRRGFRAGGVRGALTGGLRGLRGGLGGLARGARGLGGLGGLARGAGGLLKGGLRGLPLLGVGLESIDYLTGERSLNMRNLLKSGLALGGGALGGFLGSAAGPVGTVGGGMAGYAGGKALGDWLLPDQPAGGKAANASSAHTKAAAATAAATASIAATNAAMLDSDGDLTSDAPVVDTQKLILDELKALRASIQRGDGAMIGKMDQMNRLLTKIEVSAQSL